MLRPIAADLLFKGRKGDPRLGEWVKTVSQIPQEPVSAVLYGCPDDTGVRNNHGRAGAQDGPDEIRKAFYRMAVPMDGILETFSLVDAGNIIVGSLIEETHKRAQETAHEIASKDQTLIALGGGHDFAAPNFIGFVQGRKTFAPKEKVALINVDPHLDVRELENKRPHSGTPFRQILESGALSPKSFIEFGTCSNRNAQAHFDYCQKLGVTVLPLETLRSHKATVESLFAHSLKKQASAHAVLGVTIDMDSCSDVAGTSAAPVIGFTAWELCRFAEAAGREKKVKYFEIAEVAPALDPSGRTARAAAEILFSFLKGRDAVIGKNLAPKSKKKQTG